MVDDASSLAGQRPSWLSPVGPGRTRTRAPIVDAAESSAWPRAGRAHFVANTIRPKSLGTLIPLTACVARGDSVLRSCYKLGKNGALQTAKARRGQWSGQ
jgi:hypothetical protein